ncbi:Zn-dependent protease with chaperone function [Aneurinibacillus soli]|uniref:Heat shock protein HtpX n=1 Tax=Aneurinibacillus soli TaxID=1500254 RepID=A0A0U5BGF3_9BACL|nr:M48 family metallopeptidase [Aneurinibacillus soli]PYE61957.1 Zn-dependent protease with chaperone function [Aneurinibacillus soli]BAU29773.1 heat shock protein HtpX [Aneurinibacillus soli]
MQGNLVHPNEKTYFTISLVVSILIYLSLILSIIGILYIILGFIITTLFHGIMMGSIRSNGVKITKQQFASVHEKTEELCSKMGISAIPDIFVIQEGGVLNAFATRLLGRNFIVLYSDIFELIETGEEAELEFVLAHELAHIKQRHITKNMLILPAMWIPFLGNAYSRACEYTCDRMAAYYTGNVDAAMNGLTILAIGKSLYHKVNRLEYITQSKAEGGFFVWLSHLLSSHPPLPLRILELETMALYAEVYGFTSSREAVVEHL